MLPDSTGDVAVKTSVRVFCDRCNLLFYRRLNSVKAARKRRGADKDYCLSCAASLSSKPQNRKEFWTAARKLKHSHSVKSSERYYTAIQKRPSIAGTQNPMWGRKASLATKAKMRKSRIGKTGINATAWKGGSSSLNKRVRKILHTRFDWYRRVFQRDKWKCTKCLSAKQLDAHHIEPLSVIIRRLNEQNPVKDDLDWLVEQPEIADLDLTNGITLCRKCHKSVHSKKWGSHEQ